MPRINPEKIKQNTGLTPVQFQAVLMLATGKKAKLVADELDISYSQLSQWRNSHPLFIATLNDLLESAKQAASNRFRDLLDSALSTIESVMEDENAPHLARLKAAEIVLSRIDNMPKLETDKNKISKQFEAAKKSQEFFDDIDSLLL